MIRSDDDWYVLSTGRKVYANHGLIGLSHQITDNIWPADVHHGEIRSPIGEPNFGRFEVSEGFDGNVSVEDWTPAERTELAEFMISAWQAFKDAAI